MKGNHASLTVKGHSGSGREKGLVEVEPHNSPEVRSGMSIPNPVLSLLLPDRDS